MTATSAMEELLVGRQDYRTQDGTGRNNVRDQPQIHCSVIYWAQSHWLPCAIVLHACCRGRSLQSRPHRNHRKLRGIKGMSFRPSETQKGMSVLRRIASTKPFIPLPCPWEPGAQQNYVWYGWYVERDSKCRESNLARTRSPVALIWPTDFPRSRMVPSA